MKKTFKQFCLLSCLLIWTISSGFAIEVKSENSVGKDGEPILTTYFEKEPDGMAKRIIYGNGPKYRLVQYFYEPHSVNKLDHSDYFDVEFVGNNFGLGKTERIISYFRSDNIDIERVEGHHEDGMVIEETYFRKGNKNGVIFVRDHKYPNGQIQMTEQYYSDVKENTSRINTYLKTYDNGEVKNEAYQYFPNNKFMTNRITQYVLSE